MTLNKLLDKATLNTLMTIFFNFSLDKENRNNIKIISSYKKTKHTDVELTEEIMEQNNKLLSSWSGINFENKSKKEGNHVFTINIQNIEVDAFIKIIYKNIQKKRIDYSDEEFEKILLLGLFGFRGSADPAAKFYSVDIKREIQTEFYLECIFKLLTNISDLRQLNLNFRELQKDFVENKKERNTQIRIDLKWFSELIDYNLSNLNVYKDEILKELKSEIQSFKIRDKIENNFVERLGIYKHKILNKTNIDDEKQKKFTIKELRKELGFSNEKKSNERRDRSIVDIARNFYDDECVCCKNDYPLENRSFKMRKNNKYYLEIHHVISFASDKRGDQIDNLVKVCPTCHRALTKNRANEDYQKILINNILTNSETAFNYVSNFFEKPELDKMTEFVYEKLQ